MSDPVQHIGTQELAEASGLSRQRISQMVDAGELVPDVIIRSGARLIYGWKPGTVVERKKDSGPGRGSSRAGP